MKLSRFLIPVVVIALIGVGSSSLGAAAAPRRTPVAPRVQQGYYDDHLDGFVSTDSSSKAQAKTMGINFAPGLAALARKPFPFIYMIRGGVADQPMVLGSEPGEADYSPIWNEVDVTWKQGVAPVLLTSDRQISQAVKAGNLMKDKPGILLNCPVIAVDVAMGTTVTPPKVFQTYYDGHKDGMLATDVSTKAQATKQGINYSPVLGSLDPEAFPEIYIVRGTAVPHQLMILGSEPGEPDYSPLWRETIVRWKRGVRPTLITSDTQIDRLISAGKVTERESTVVLNCPVTSGNG